MMEADIIHLYITMPVSDWDAEDYCEEFSESEHDLILTLFRKRIRLRDS